ncbi:MAG: MBL fold metallo-hydrolase [Candidatus Omnitrophica bacterium]|nr:MBL fold metallo-hydrolase [Candidatus Omnitrophota bacterium]MBU1929540.1 MBL fold metallo-hydrolase [Candidatus Omnitrophota bacterium]MBU2035827.1 MBL fold metallo-hydrolase [Candidatus Omnitrophota bacterium]MBU2221582.1 MBL fold metallo-hydrolase [Candidatus Omnitrophota bacterium]MBU2258399.1 MBL fold metallo-hydrolase [Candidatus Omnitrophota bacterium]
MILERIVVGPVQSNCYILAIKGTDQAVIIDPGDEEAKIRKVLTKHNLNPGIIINTHGHYDHIGSDGEFKVAIYIHQADLAFLKEPGLNLSGFFAPQSFALEDAVIKTVQEKDIISFEGIKLEVIHLPGHTPGGIGLLLKEPVGNILFTGDSLFCEGIGRTDFPGASEDALIGSIKGKLFKLPDETIIYPGHGPSSTIKREKEHNPYLI